MLLMCVFQVTFLPQETNWYLEGHTAPVFFVRTDSTNSRIYSVGNDNTIMVRKDVWSRNNKFLHCFLFYRCGILLSLQV